MNETQQKQSNIMETSPNSCRPGMATMYEAGTRYNVLKEFYTVSRMEPLKGILKKLMI